VLPTIFSNAIQLCLGFGDSLNPRVPTRVFPPSCLDEGSVTGQGLPARIEPGVPRPGSERAAERPMPRAKAKPRQARLAGRYGTCEPVERGLKPISTHPRFRGMATIHPWWRPVLALADERALALYFMAVA
jgi:hypothetical protein